MTDSCKRWPKYLLEQAIASPPEDCEGLIVQGSTPVVSFGNPVRATVATISLNPSPLEFLESWNGPMLPEHQHRLVTLESLGISDYKDINCSLGAQILDGCARYFEQNPYEKWFLPLDCILRAGARASYYADARPDARYLDLACHLDLSPWATSNSWGKLTASDKKSLKDKGIHFLDEHICYGQYSLVLVNGIEAKDSIEINGKLVDWTPVSHAEYAQSVEFYKAMHFDTLFLAWRYIQRELQNLPVVAKLVAKCYDEFLNERRTT